MVVVACAPAVIIVSRSDYTVEQEVRKRVWVTIASVEGKFSAALFFFCSMESL